MRVLLDEQLPLDLAAVLQGHTVDTVAGRGWTGITNGELLRRMEGVRAPSNRMAHLEPLVPAILRALAVLKAGQLLRIGG